MSVYTKHGKQLSDTISCQNDIITSTSFVVFFALLRSNRSTSFALMPSYYQSEVRGRLVSDYDVLRVKQNGKDRNGSIFVPPADAKQSCAGLLEQSVSDSCRGV